MNSKDFVVKCNKKTQEVITTLKKKNADYAKEEDAFVNFRFSENIGIGMENAVLVRIFDKIVRISNLMDKDPKVKSESIIDTADDLIGYAVILAIMLEERVNKSD